MERKIYYKNEFYEAVEKKTKIKLNYTQQLILSLFDKEGLFEYSPDKINEYHFIESTFRNNLKTLIKNNIIIKVNNNLYELNNDVKKKLYLTKGFYVNTELFNNPKLTQASVILYSFFDKFSEGFILRKSGIRQYISMTDKTLYENIKILLEAGLLKKEKTKFNNQYCYTTLPPVDSETIENTTPTIDVQPTTDVEVLNQRLTKASEVCKQLLNEIERLKTENETLNKKINSLYDKQLKYIKLFQPVIERIDEINSDVNSIYHLTDNIRQKQETELNMNMLRGLI